MIKINNFDKLLKTDRALTFGKFDGIHLGHCRLIEKIVNKEFQGLVSTVFTFDKPPGSLFVHKNDSESDLSLNTLLTKEEKELKLSEKKVNTLFEYEVTNESMSIPADEFVVEIIQKKLNAKYVAVGEDFHFGYKRQGDVSLLNKMAVSCGYELEVVEKERLDGEIISSSRIKEQLRKGNIELVNRLLGYNYSISGEIIKGNQLGRTWNIPTINIAWQQEKMPVRFGVYYSKVKIEDKIYFGMTNIGCKPSIEGAYMPGAETYLYNCNENLYGKKAEVILLNFRRPEQKFSSINELIEQLQEDIKAGEHFLNIS